ncbi:hypothetical protein [Amycolatopsis sp. cmx-4-68]|uniref:hypothetical protein n=1 Tax=Amycolatopsis sp. cmx-4-68 TaxID=2790938 RepID=UPI00397AC76B
MVLAGDDATADAFNRACPGYEQGEWTTNTPDLAIGTPTLINNWIPFTGATIQGIAYSAGVFTVGVGGEYTISLACRFTASTADRYCFISGSGASPVWTKSSTAQAATGLNTSCAITKRIPAGGTIRCYAYSGAAANVTHEAAGDLVTGVTIYRLGN